MIDRWGGWLWLMTSVLGCGSQSAAPPAEVETRHTIMAIMDSIAIGISNRDADGVAARVPPDSSVVYVSDGKAFRGYELRDTLRNYYGTLKALSFTWDSIRLAPIGTNTWVVTAWSKASATDTAGRSGQSHATSTWTFGWTGRRWQLGSANKITLP